MYGKFGVNLKGGFLVVNRRLSKAFKKGCSCLINQNRLTYL